MVSIELGPPDTERGVKFHPFPPLLRYCPALPVTQVSVEWLFSAVRLLLSDLRSRLKQDAEAMLLLHTNEI